MSKVLRTVGQVAGVVAGAALIVSTAGIGGAAVAAAAASVSKFATIASVVGSIGAQITAKSPTAKGQVNERIIGANNPQPYLMGRSYSGGIQVHDVGWGGEVDDVQNPYRFIAAVYSCCGPVESLESVQLDFAATSFSGTAASGYYANYLYRDYQLGARPEADALSPNWAGTPDWGSSYKLSGYAAIGYSLKWSKKGKRFAGGQIPVIGAIWEGVKVYDPRLDSTYPGGSGSHRITDESTWAYSRNPALHALTYAYGRYVNGVKVFGVDLGDAAIDLDKAVAWANVCDTNSWYVDGTIYEPGDKWDNLKRICEAGAAQPVLKGGVLSFDYQAARTSLANVTRDDLASDDVNAKLIGKGWKARHNTLVPRYRSEAHQWNYVQAEQAQVGAWVTADGEEKLDERQWDLVTGVNQVTQLAYYDLYQRREAGPFTIYCKPHMRLYGPGDCLTLKEELGLHPDGDVKAIVRSRTVDPNTGVVTLELEQETDGKHTAALAATGVAPSTITLPTSEDFDDAYGSNRDPAGLGTIKLASSYTRGLAGNITQTHDGAGTGTVTLTIPNHTRIYADGTAVSVIGDDFTLDQETTYLLCYDDPDFAGGTLGGDLTLVEIVPGVGGQTAADAYFSETNPSRHYLAQVTTVDETGAGGGTGGSSPPGGGGWNGDDPGANIP